MFKNVVLLSALCFCLPLVGCGGSDEDSAGLARPQEEAPEGPPPGARTTLEGNWALVISGGGKDQLPAILEVTAAETDGEMTASVLEFSDVLRNSDESAPADGLKLASAEAKDGKFEFVLDIYGSQFSFRGQLQDGVVIGDIVVDGGSCSPGLLIPTEETTFEGKPTSHESPGLTELNTGLQKAPDKLGFLKNWAATHPTSPLALAALRQAVMAAKFANMKEEDLKKITDQWLETAKIWGPRLEISTRVQIAVTLAYVEYNPEVVFGYLDEAAKHADSKEFTNIQQRIDDARRQAQLVEAIAHLDSKDEAKQKQGFAFLKEIRQEQPYNTEVAYVLAQYHSAHDAEEAAMAVYAELAVLPFLERQTLEIAQKRGIERVPPTVALEELWKKKHGSDKGLEAFLDQTYQKSFTAFAQPPVEPRTAGNRVALIELFTGSQCPPCVGADAALAGIEKTFPTDQVVVLRYHQHNPGPDPMANDASEARFYYYRGTGTPKIVVNGDDEQQYGGFMLSAEPIYDSIKERVTKTLKETTDVAFAADAEIRDGKLVVNASATGFDATNADLRLRLVLAEDDVEFLAPNYVRHHEMVVRGVLSGTDGIAVEKSELKYSGTTDLTELRNGLADYIHRFEEGQGQEFPVKPLVMEKLHLVAFVQDDKTREVLQAVAVPIKGKITYPPLPVFKTEEKATEKDPAATNSKDEAKTPETKTPAAEPKKKDAATPTPKEKPAQETPPKAANPSAKTPKAEPKPKS